MTEPLLRVENLQTHFASELGTIKAVDGVSFDIPRGGILGMVGESGSGKSVTGLSILRLLGSRNATIAGGRILFRGEDLLTKSEAEMRAIRGGSISMVFQNAMTSLDPFFRVGEQLVEVLRLHQGLSKKEAREKALNALELVRIPDPVAKLKSHPHQLSGGQRQRVVVALALACEPDLLIADEPTTALDATVQKQIIELLQEINQELGTAILMVTHDMGVVAHMCRTVAVMYAGRIVEHGDVADVLRTPQHPYTRGLMASVPRLRTEAAGEGHVRQRLYQIGGSAPLPLRLTDGCAFAPRCPEVGPECWEVDPPTVASGAGQEAVCHRRAEEKAELTGVAQHVGA
ncbi:oligopeptide transport system ATP-binding protein [Blastococcus aggregatus]|uniref:Oligopeptide transport system ATP-binding protein n=1 Tax=Blastococcus aggregatus TaxID=38502 RepID=A0A285VCU3_9ACTN|nr:ABC transporter ATP-binding protein [Blastococcus aggregatus]SOC50321.1 oligopeptide transport system ATP-binding protein [Blastococcus aggregatus]